MKSIISLSMFIYISITGLAYAQIVLNATLDQFEVEKVGTNRYSSRFFAATGDGLVQDFSDVGEVTITYNLLAPAGKFFELFTQPDWTDLEFEIKYSNGFQGKGEGRFRDESPQIMYEPAGGNFFNPASFNLDLVQISGPGGDANTGTIRGTPTAGTTYHFSGVSILSTVNTGYNADISSAFNFAFIEITATSSDFSSGPPPAFSSLVVIPEPSSTTMLFLISLGTLLAFRQCRRNVLPRQ